RRDQDPGRGAGAVADLFAAGQLRRTDAGASIGRDAGRSAAGRAPHRVTANVPPVRARAASAQGGGAGGGTAAAGGYDQGQSGYRYHTLKGVPGKALRVRLVQYRAQASSLGIPEQRLRSAAVPRLSQPQTAARSPAL